MRIILGLLVSYAAFSAGASVCRAEVSIRQAEDRSVEVATGVYTAKIDAKGNLTELAVKGAKAFAHQFGDPGKTPAEPPAVAVNGKAVTVQSGTARVEWTFGEDTLGFATEGYTFECTLDGSVKGFSGPNGRSGPADTYAGGVKDLVLANDFMVTSKGWMHKHDRRYFHSGYTNGSVKPGAPVSMELRVGQPAAAAQLLGDLAIKPIGSERRRLPAGGDTVHFAAPESVVFTLLEANVGLSPQTLRYQAVVRRADDERKRPKPFTIPASLAPQAVHEAILEVTKLPAGAYVLTVSARQGDRTIKEASLPFAVGLPPVPAAPASPATVPPRPANAAAFRWEDRRPIAHLFLSQNHHRTDANPDGYLNRDVNVLTDEGRAKFRTDLLAYADNCIQIIKDNDGQGMIVWDLEGYRWPGMVYVGDPRVLPDYAPAMERVADDLFKKFRDAGLRTGVTIRPNRISRITDKAAIAMWGEWGYTYQRESDVVRELVAMIDYAKNRWGCTLFYLDSNSYVENGTKDGVNPSHRLTATMIEELHAAHPEVLVIPEHPQPGYHACTAQYRELRGGSAGTPAAERTADPHAFSVISFAGMSDDGWYTNWERLADCVQQGDVHIFDGWYPSRSNELTRLVYRQAAYQKAAGTVPADASEDRLLELAKDADAAVRFNAVRQLGAKRAKAAAPALVAMLDAEKDWLVRKEAIVSLASIQGAGAIDVLAAEVKKATGHRTFAREQLRALGKAALPAALDLAKSDNPQNRSDAASLLGTIITSPALEALRALADDAIPAVKQQASAALAGRLSF